MINFSDAMASVLEPVSPMSPEGTAGANAGGSKGKGALKAGNSNGGNNGNNNGKGGSNGTNGTSRANSGVSDVTKPPLVKEPSASNVIGKVTLVVSNLHKALLEQRDALREQQTKMDDQLAAIVDIQKFLAELPQT